LSPQILKDFHARYYSANLMKLVVIAREPLDELQALVTELFSPVVNKDVTAHLAFEARTPWTPDTLGKEVCVVPIKESRNVEVGREGGVGGGTSEGGREGGSEGLAGWLAGWLVCFTYSPGITCPPTFPPFHLPTVVEMLFPLPTMWANWQIKPQVLYHCTAF
jgi:hypothetical protein